MTAIQQRIVTKEGVDGVLRVSGLTQKLEWVSLVDLGREQSHIVFRGAQRGGAESDGFATGKFLGAREEEHSDVPSTVPGSVAGSASEEQVRSGESEPVVVKKPKAFCTRCQCVVVCEGHEQRCVNPRVVSDSTSSIRRMGWVGDVVHQLDVRRYLIAVGIPDDELQWKAQQYVERSAQAEYFSKVPSPPVPALGGSVKQLSAAFEANYCGEFRLQYLRVTFGSQVNYFMPSYMSPHMGGFPFL